MIVFKSASRFAFTLLIVSFAIHNLEEALHICNHPVVFPKSFFKPLSCEQFVFATIVLTVISLIAYIAALRTTKKATYLFISTAIAAALLINAFIPHIAVAIYTLHYTPGVYSAIFLLVPLSIYILIQNRKASESVRQFAKYVIAGIAAGYLLFVITLLISKLLIAVEG